VTPAANRYRLAFDRVSGHTMPTGKSAEEAGDRGGKRIRTQAGDWFRVGVTRGVRLG
jgi:hypothetical protein